MGIIAATARLIGSGDKVVWKMFSYIIPQYFWFRGHREGLAAKKVGGAMNFPAPLVDVDANV
tara:strand:+ start:113 stop:298 length:186 start_codon:yes stop_codon:yes gene_type:complete